MNWEIPRIGESSIVTKDDFVNNLALFTENQLKNINWDNVFVAGGK